jgi:hypothetical protein
LKYFGGIRGIRHEIHFALQALLKQWDLPDIYYDAASPSASASILLAQRPSVMSRWQPAITFCETLISDIPAENQQEDYDPIAAGKYLYYPDTPKSSVNEKQSKMRGFGLREQQPC